MSDPECPSKKKKTAADEPSFFQTFGDFASESGVLPAATTRRVGCSQLQLHRQIVQLSWSFQIALCQWVVQQNCNLLLRMFS